MTSKTYGKMPTSVPAGFAKAVRFPVLAAMDFVSGDGRELVGEGGTVRDNVMPLTIRTQLAASSGHGGALPSGALFEVTIDPESGEFSGRGFLLDDEVGLKSINYIATGAMNKNSIDLADVKVRFIEDLDTGEYWLQFVKWAQAATTLVATPAFPQAYAEIDEELTASLLEDPMEELVASFTSTDIIVIGLPEEEVVADGADKPPREWFFTPEAAHPQKIIVDDNGRVYGHLALWDSCHDGMAGKCIIVPRPSDAYASFNKPGVLTDHGMVDTGPIFAFGGHRKSKSAPTIEQAYGGIENAWGDVRVIEGQFGPWISGYVRPGTTELTTIAARASRISGHWVGNRLKAIVSVNAEGFDVPGMVGGELDLVAGFAASIDDDGITEVLASFPPCIDDVAPKGFRAMDISEEDLDRIVARLGGTMTFTSNALTLNTTDFITKFVEEHAGTDAPILDDARRAALALLLEEDED